MSSTDIAGAEYFRGLADRLRSAPHGSKGELIREACEFLGKSEGLVRDELKRVGWSPDRKKRNDKGKYTLSLEEAEVLSNIMVESRRANGKALLPVKDAIEIAFANERISCMVAESTALRIMREYGVHPGQVNRPDTFSQMRSKHPNHVWQFDVSVCVLYYMDKGGLTVMDADRFYKNKPQNFREIANERVLRYLITDHYSGAFFLQYYLSPGEDQQTLFLFLLEAFAPSSHPQDPLHGVPFKFIWDAGSANQSHLISNFLNLLGVDHWAHEPGNPRAKGQVETTHNLVERHFEGRLSLQETEGINQLNEKAHIWMRNFNGTRKHTRHGHTRYGLWQTIQTKQLRICPNKVICKQLLTTKPERRQVKGNLIIQYAIKGFGSNDYSVEHVPNIRQGEYLDVCVNPYKAPSIYVIAEDEEGRTIHFECEPIEKDRAGFPVHAPIFGEEYKPTRDTETDKARKRMAKTAYGVSTDKEVKDARRKRKPAFGGEIDPFSYLEGETPAFYMNREGTSLNVPARAHAEVEKKISVDLALISLSKRQSLRDLGMTPKIRELLNNQYPEGVSPDSLDEVRDFIVRANKEETPITLTKQEVV